MTNLAHDTGTPSQPDSLQGMLFPLLTPDQCSVLQGLEQREQAVLSVSAHNPVYADMQVAKIKAAEQMLVPHVQAAEVAAHEKFGLLDLATRLLGLDCSPDLFKALEDCANKYQVWQVSRIMPAPAGSKPAWPDYAVWSGIEHPSFTVTRAQRAALKVRGFVQSTQGWSSPDGASVPVHVWLVPRPVPDSDRLEWTDPANLLSIHAKYDAQFEAVLVAAVSARARYLDAYELADAERALGKAVSDSPHQANTIEQLAWERAFAGELQPWRTGRGYPVF